MTEFGFRLELDAVNIEDNEWVDGEFKDVADILEALTEDFVIAHGFPPSILYISDEEELQSIYMYWAEAFELDYERTEKITHLE